MADVNRLPEGAVLYASDGENLRLFLPKGADPNEPQTVGILQDLSNGGLVEMPVRAAMANTTLKPVDEETGTATAPRQTNGNRLPFFDVVKVNGKPVPHTPLPAPGTRPSVFPSGSPPAGER